MRAAVACCWLGYTAKRNRRSSAVREHRAAVKRLFLYMCSRESFLSGLEGRGGFRIVIDPLRLMVSQSPAALDADMGDGMVVGVALMEMEER